MPQQEIIFFSIFILLICLLLLLDLGVFTSTEKPVSYKNAISWTIIWVSLAILFYFFLLVKGDTIHDPRSVADINVLIEIFQHPINIDGLSFEEAVVVYRKNLGLEYLTGYLIEYSLSVDNVFVMIMIFLSFGVRPKYYKWILFWGIAGAIIMRFLFIFVSAALIHKFSWILYVFGAFLIFTGIMMFIRRNKEEKIEPQQHPVVRFASRYLAVFPRTVGRRFFVRKKDGHLFITPLFLVLLVIEFTDVIFAVDSVPAIFSVTKDPYIVFFSNIFAIIGLRSLFFLVMNIMNSFDYLKTGLSFLLVLIGVKMMLSHETLDSIGFTTSHFFMIVVAILGLSILASIIKRETEKRKTGHST